MHRVARLFPKPLNPNWTHGLPLKPLELNVGRRLVDACERWAAAGDWSVHWLTSPLIVVTPISALYQPARSAPKICDGFMIAAVGW
jgi:hypothetical protein